MNFISITGGSNCNIRNENFAMKLEKKFSRMTRAENFA